MGLKRAVPCAKPRRAMVNFGFNGANTMYKLSAETAVGLDQLEWNGRGACMSAITCNICFQSFPAAHSGNHLPPRHAAEQFSSLNCRDSQCLCNFFGPERLPPPHLGVCLLLHFKGAKTNRHVVYYFLQIVF